MQSLTILNDEEYFTEIIHRIAAAKRGDRVALMTMSFDPSEPRTEPLMRELYAAADRGVRVQLNVDAISFMLVKNYRPDRNILSRPDPAHMKGAYFQRRYAALEQLQRRGGQFAVTNLPSRGLTNPFAGRSHIKLTVINQETYIGGCNLGQTWQIDLMVRLPGPALSDWVYDFILKAAREPHLMTMLDGRDFEHRIDAATSLLIDAGVKGQSLIYDRTLELIDSAQKRIVITCQYFPGSTTAEHLLAAHRRGVQVIIYFGNAANQGGLRWPHTFAEFRERTKYPKSFFSRRLDRRLPRLHAKLLATEAAAMIGSHNYVTQGVRFGTAESTLLREDPAFAREAVKAFEARLQSALV